MRAVLRDDDGHSDEVTLVHIVTLSEMDSVELLELKAVADPLEISVFVAVPVVNDVEVGDTVLDTLVVALTE